MTLPDACLHAYLIPLQAWSVQWTCAPRREAGARSWPVDSMRMMLRCVMHMTI
jgi:hypothetical protein